MKPSPYPSAGPTIAAIPITKLFPTPNPFELWQPVNQDLGEGDEGIQAGTLLVLTWCHLVN